MQMFRLFYVLSLALVFSNCRLHNKDTDHQSEIKNEYDTPKDKMSPAEIGSYQKKLSELFDNELINKNFAGGILVAKGGNILYEKYSGFRDPSKIEDSINENTVFHLASTSKPFTAIAILRLVQEGKLSLSDELIKFFPGFPYPSVTIRNLLSHRSGLPNYLYFMDDNTKWAPKRMITNADVLNFMITYNPPLNYPVGKHFSYCNTNFVLLALVIEKITKQSFPLYLKKTIFEPLNMENTFVFTPADSFRVTLSYKPSGAVWQNDKFEYTYGDKNVYSTPQDMLKWDQALYNENFISKAMLDSAYTPFSNESPSIHNYGLGWRMLNLPNGKRVIYHNGKWHGFTPAFARLLDEKAVIIILGNRYNFSIYKASKLAYNVFGDYMQENTEDEEENIQVPNDPIVAPHVVEKKVIKPVVADKPRKTVVKVPEKKIKSKDGAKKRPVIKAAANNQRKKPEVVVKHQKPTTKVAEKKMKAEKKQKKKK
jgi:CubicO group peptidase (beta-lactamase class C family)